MQILTCMYLWMYQDAVFPSLTDSTVVCDTPARSPPQKTPDTDVVIVFPSTSGVPHLFNFTGSRAFFTARNKNLLK